MRHFHQRQLVKLHQIGLPKAQWICLRLLSSSPGFENQAHYRKILWYICHCVVQKGTKMNKKRLSLAHFKNCTQRLIQRCVTGNFWCKLSGVTVFSQENALLLLSMESLTLWATSLFNWFGLDQTSKSGQLAELSLPIPKVRDSNRVIGKILYSTYLLLAFEKTKVKTDEAGNKPIFKKKQVNLWFI